MLLLLVAFLTVGKCSMIDEQSSLSTKLLKNYDSKIRPVEWYNETVKVKFKVYFNQILDVVSKNFYYRPNCTVKPQCNKRTSFPFISCRLLFFSYFSTMYQTYRKRSNII